MSLFKNTCCLTTYLLQIYKNPAALDIEFILLKAARIESSALIRKIYNSLLLSWKLNSNTAHDLSFDNVDAFAEEDLQLIVKGDDKESTIRLRYCENSRVEISVDVRTGKIILVPVGVSGIDERLSSKYLFLFSFSFSTFFFAPFF